MPTSKNRKRLQPHEATLGEWLKWLAAAPNTAAVEEEPGSNRTHLTPARLRACLNSMHEQGFSNLWVLTLKAWLEWQGIQVPEGLFSTDPQAPGTGRTLSDERIKLWVKSMQDGIASPAELAKKHLKYKHARNSAAARKEAEAALKAGDEIFQGLLARLYERHVPKRSVLLALGGLDPSDIDSLASNGREE